MRGLLKRCERVERSVTVKTDDITRHISRAFDYTFDGTSRFACVALPEIDEDFSIGLIVGPSGSGKTTLLSEFGEPSVPKWERAKCVASHFKNGEDAVERLTGVGLSSIPSMLRPYHVLSTGERFRADMARVLKDGIVVDEFTSVVDRSVAAAVCNGVHKYIHRHKLRRVVFASCHYDIIEWLRPDWCFDLMSGEFHRGRYLQRPQIELRVFPCKTSLWFVFRDHHYLSAELQKSAKCFAAFWHQPNGEDRLVAFESIMAMPSGQVSDAWREHRLVVLPDYQGLGIGPAVSEFVGDMLARRGKRFFSRTMHPGLGEYRTRSGRWRETTSSRIVAPSNKGDLKHTWKSDDRPCFSHEYIGSARNESTTQNQPVKVTGFFNKESAA